jgi:hypothetical protein
MTVEKEIEKLYNEMHTVQLDRRFAVQQPVWDKLHARYLELDAEIKRLKSSKIHANLKAKLTTEFSL